MSRSSGENVFLSETFSFSRYKLEYTHVDSVINRQPCLSLDVSHVDLTLMRIQGYEILHIKVWTVNWKRGPGSVVVREVNRRGPFLNLSLTQRYSTWAWTDNDLALHYWQCMYNATDSGHRQNRVEIFLSMGSGNPKSHSQQLSTLSSRRQETFTLYTQSVCVLALSVE